MTHDPQQHAEIWLNDVSVSFPLYHGGSRSLKSQLLQSTLGKISSDRHNRVVVKALQGVTLHFERGDRVALIGVNGAGKTTLLRVMAGIYEPESGVIDVHGRVSPMFDIGLGIDAELSGYDNIRLRSMLLGVGPREIEGYMADITEFTQLGPYLELPVRTYSSGMSARLTFAIATCFKPEVLLMDEWIVAGDASFLARAERRVSSFVTNASILVLASHSAEICRRWCNKAVWLENGSVKAMGDLSDVLADYEKFTMGDEKSAIDYEYPSIASRS